jgi:NADH:ubiquinone reductase (H+-translocating)
MTALDVPAPTDQLTSQRILGGRRAGVPHVVIVGGGFGGLTAARALKRAPVQVTLIDRQNHHLFQMLLYQVATAGLSPGDIASPIRWILRRQGNVDVLLGEALGVDTAARRLRCDFGDVSYDYLFIATGSTHAYFGHDDWQAHAPGLKTLDDALSVRAKVLLAFERAERSMSDDERRRLLTFVIVGGGPTGVELAGALAEIARHSLRQEFRRYDPMAATVLLLEGGPAVLPSFPPDLQTRAQWDLQRLGVTVRTGAIVTGIEDEAVYVGDERIEAGTVLWAAGVAASPLGRSLGVPVDRVGRVIVEPDLSIPGHREVFVLGDLASMMQDGKPLPGVAPVAMQQATHAVAGLVRDLEGQPRVAFRYHDPGNLATIGRAAAVADLGWIRLTGWIAWAFWLFVHILKLTGFRNRVVVFVQWSWAYFTYQRSIRLITGSSRQGPAPRG